MSQDGADGEVEDLDVVVVGAGLSGIGAACRLARDEPRRTVAVLEARDATGGTWDLFGYPGVRSDSDMYTLGYPFRPWRHGPAIAAGADILDYLRETAAAYGVDRRVRTGHRVVRAVWSSAHARWRLTVARADGEVTLRCRFLWVCTGYYRYDHGHTPTFPGQDTFTGLVVHPQHWPADLDCTDRRVVVVGSGATAVTLVPALARQAARVSMVQRSPAYVATVATRDPLVRRLSGKVPHRALVRVVRARNIATQLAVFTLSRRRPALVRAALRRAAVRRLPAGYDVDTHFSPAYAPWDQRLCVSPDGDLFDAITSGRAEVVTDTVARFTPTGVVLGSGRELPADVVVTATGLELLALGGLTLAVDGHEVDPGRTLAYKGLMLAGVPNLAMTVGYVNASWTLRADLVARYVVRLLRHLDRHGLASVTPVPPAEAGPGQHRPLVDLQAGYVRRGAHKMPQQGRRWPWLLPQSYLRDLRLLRLGRLTDEVRFARVPRARSRADAPQEVGGAGVPVR